VKLHQRLRLGQILQVDLTADQTLGSVLPDTRQCRRFKLIQLGLRRHKETLNQCPELVRVHRRGAVPRRTGRQITHADVRVPVDAPRCRSASTDGKDRPSIRIDVAICSRATIRSRSRVEDETARCPLLWRILAMVTSSDDATTN
jgi:hypothetical protein